jgi:hypothetical protein
MQINIHLIISRSHLLRIRNVSDKSCRENQNTHFTSNRFFFFTILPFMKRSGKIRRTGQATDDKRSMRISCWIPKSTNTYSKYVILIAFPLQPRLHER